MFVLHNCQRNGFDAKFYISFLSSKPVHNFLLKEGNVCMPKALLA